MFRPWAMMLGAMLLLSMLAVGQTSKALTEGMPSSAEIATAALYTYLNYTRAFQAGDAEEKREGNEIVIPSQYWTEPIKALKAIDVYTHGDINIVVVLRVENNIEEGKYIHTSVSSLIPRNGYDGFEFTPNPWEGNTYVGYEVVDYKRVRNERQTVSSLSETAALHLNLAARVQNYSLNANNFLDALTHVAADFRLPMGIEWVNRPDAKVSFNQSWKNVTVKEILRDIVKTQPNYEVQIRNGVLHILTPRLIPDQQNFLNQKVGDFMVDKQSVEIVSVKLQMFVNNIVSPPKPGPHGIGFSIASNPSEPDLSFEIKDTNVKEILNTIIYKSARKIWIVTFSDSEMTESGFCRTLSLWDARPIPDERQPVWNLFHWGDALPTVLLESR